MGAPRNLTKTRRRAERYNDESQLRAAAVTRANDTLHEWFYEEYIGAMVRDPSRRGPPGVTEQTRMSRFREFVSLMKDALSREPLTDVEWFEVRSRLDTHEAKAHQLLGRVRQVLHELVAFADEPGPYNREFLDGCGDRPIDTPAVRLVERFAEAIARPALLSEALNHERPSPSRPLTVKRADLLYGKYGPMPRRVLACFSVTHGNWPAERIAALLREAKGAGITVSDALEAEAEALDNHTRKGKRSRTEAP
jgi:hypothetical protein